MSISPPTSLPPTAPRAATRSEVLIGVVSMALVAIIFVPTLFLLMTYNMRTVGVAGDVSKLAAEVEAAVINDPEAISFEYVPPGEYSTVGTLIVGDSPAVTFKASTRHIDISISAVDENGAKVENGDPAAVPGEYIIEGYYTREWGWGGGTADNPITYESRVGEVVKS